MNNTFGLITITTNGCFGNRHQSFNSEHGTLKGLQQAIDYLTNLHYQAVIEEARKQEQAK